MIESRNSSICVTPEAMKEIRHMLLKQTENVNEVKRKLRESIDILNDMSFSGIEGLLLGNSMNNVRKSVSNGRINITKRIDDSNKQSYVSSCINEAVTNPVLTKESSNSAECEPVNVHIVRNDDPKITILGKKQFQCNNCGKICGGRGPAECHKKVCYR